MSNNKYIRLELGQSTTVVLHPSGPLINPPSWARIVNGGSANLSVSEDALSAVITADQTSTGREVWAVIADSGESEAGFLLVVDVVAVEHVELNPETED